jgi:hypothetical protein
MEAAYYIINKEVMNMKTNMSKIGLYIGIGAGLVLFALGGLLAGSFIGGSIGVTFAKNVVGGTIESSLLTRLILLVSMLLGVLLSGVLFLISTSSLGWLIGYTMDAVVSDRTVERQAAVDSH